MKKIFSFREFLVVFFGIMLIGGTTISCKNESNEASEAAEEINEERFDDNDSKEDDSEFLVDAATLDLKEIELSKLALRSANADVKSVGQMMQDAHTKSYNEIKMLAEQKQIAVPQSISQDAIEDYKDLSEKTGKDFDDKYLDIIVDKHEKAVKKYEDYINDANDAEIKNWATTTLATLRTHLDHTKKLEEKY